MKDPVPSFIRSAKQFALSSEEKVLIANHLGIRVSHQPSKRLSSMTATVFLKKMKAMTLTPVEKATMREWLINAMEQKAKERWWLHPLKHMTSIVAGVLIITITSGSLSYAAENAVPGDVLYPMKVNVNETVRGALKKTPEDQARWEAEKAERRLKEAEMMTMRASMTDEKQAQIQERFRKHADALRTRIAEMPTPVATAIGQRFEAKLRAHGRALQKMSALHPERTRYMQNLLDDVQDERMKVEEHLVATTVRGDDGETDHDVTVTIAQRQALRRDVEIHVLADLPQSSTATAIIDPSPPTMMMNAVPVMKQVEQNENEEDDEDTGDMAFSIEARMRVTKRKLHELRENMHRPDRPTPNDIEIRMMGAEQILNVAESQMENGNIDDALRASDMALRHAEKARREGEKRMRVK